MANYTPKVAGWSLVLLCSVFLVYIHSREKMAKEACLFV